MKFIKNIIKKYAGMPTAAKAAVWFTLCSFLQRGIQFIVVPIYTRVLTPTEYGYYSVFTSWSEIVMIFCTLNLFYNSYNVGITKFSYDRNKFTSSLLGLCYALTLSCFGIYLIFRDKFNNFFGMNTELCIMMFTHLLIMSSYQFWAARQRYEYKYKILIVTTLFLAIGTPTLSLTTILFMKNNIFAVIGSKICIEIFIGIFTLAIILKNCKILFNKFYWKYGFTSNIKLVPYYLSQIILSHSDRLMINKMCGASQAGIYSVAYSASMILTMLNVSLNNSIIPWKFNKLKNKDISKIGDITFSLMIVIMIMNALLITFAPEALKILASNEYYDAIWIVPPVACSAYLLFVSQQFINIEFYFEKNSYAAYSSIIVAVMNLILNYIFIPRCGYIAAGYTTLASYIVFTIIHYISMRLVCKKYLNSENIWNIKKIIILSSSLFIIATIMLIGYKITIIRYFIASIIILLVILKRDKFIEIVRNQRRSHY